MKFRTSLRYRVTFFFALIGAFASVGFSAVLYVLNLNMEGRLVAEMLSTELDDYVSRYRSDPNAPTPSSTSLYTYFLIPGKEASAPAELRELQDGMHTVNVGNQMYFARVKRLVEGRVIVLYDAARIYRRENQFLALLSVGVLVMTVMSALLGYWLAGRVVSPISALASRVGQLKPEDRPEPLEDDFPGDELGELAHVFDLYHKRLADFIEREQSFTSDVSHELRTPLAVMKGAAEVLQMDNTLTQEQQGRVQRIARSAKEMSGLVVALLMLAREKDLRIESARCRVDDILRDVVEANRYALDHKPVTVEMDLHENVEIFAEPVLLRIVLGNIVRNAFAYTRKGCVSLHLDHSSVLVRDTGVGMSPEEQSRVFERYYRSEEGGEGIGMSLVKRICQLYDWRIQIESIKSEGTTIRLGFCDTAAM